MIEELKFLGKFTQKNFLGGGGGGSGGGGGGLGHGGVGLVGGVRVDVNEELKSFCENSKKKFGGGGGGGGVELGGGGVRVDVNEELKFL